MTGVDIAIPEMALTIHQPSIEEITLLGDDSIYLMGIQTLTLSKTLFEDKGALATVSNFQIFMTVMREKETREKKKAVLQTLPLLFPQFDHFLLTPSSLLLQKNGEDAFIVDDKNFDILQDYIREITCQNSNSIGEQSFNPDPTSELAKSIARKLMRGRERVAAQRHNPNSSIFNQYLSVLAIGLHLDLRTLSKYTMYQLYDQIERFVLQLNWDIDLKSRLAGGKPNKEPDNWMKDIHS